MDARKIGISIVMGICLLTEGAYTITQRTYAYRDAPHLKEERVEAMNAPQEKQWEGPTQSTPKEPIVTYVQHEEASEIPFDTMYQDDETIPLDEQRTVQQGINGILIRVYQDVYHDDVVVDRELVSEIVSEAMQPEIIAVGTKRPEPVIEKPMAQPPVIQGTFNDEAARAMFTAMNQARQEQGLQAFAWSNQLFEYAKTRASEVAINFDHIRPNGSNWDSLNPDIIYAENLAMRAYRVETAMDSFRKSPTHWKNITSSFPKAAVATYIDTDGEWYWVQLFGY